jgi:hypothetical protein
MGTVSNVAEKTKDLAVFRERAARLQQLPDNDWTEWEWLGDMARKPDTYTLSEKERQKLAQINSYAKSSSGYDGLSVATMVNMCHRYHLDFPEEDSDFVVDLYRRQVQTLRKRQLQRLVKLYAESGENIAASWSYAHAEPA